MTSLRVTTVTQKLTVTSTEILTKTMVLVRTSTTTTTIAMPRTKVLNNTITVFREFTPSSFVVLAAALFVGISIGMVLGRRVSKS